VSSIRLSLAQARRLAVSSQLMPAPRERGILDVARHLGYFQLDQSNSVARTLARFVGADSIEA
jgi:hypothetical protein